ncbi:YibE/F family protein [Deinococcus peraridilitoris]|uniref:YibE/F-like protein n=1 Tax=Deinococcus peraridilitoris (strain DSM 19664 / LMG 22246 / CIP 109416 / KR-200) TaxID=937777 RepID=L0A086_DEIPD|nr:YibE/F family protein [Deinococcus peraridilitoris]AFZ66864.1 YibE/F-like protein [Deinococcus peraridilitoris DSM 19664]
MRLPALLLALLLTSCAAAQNALPDKAIPLGTYLRGTFEQMYGPEEAVVTLDNGDIVNVTIFQDASRFEPKQRVVVWKTGNDYLLDAPIRYPQLLVQLGLFLGLATLIGRAKGVRAVLGTLASLGVLMTFVVPRLAQGENIITTMLLAVPGILIFTLYFVHGVNRKTSAALLGTLCAAGTGFFLTLYFSRAMHFTGLSTTGGYAAQSLFGLDALGLFLVSVVLGAVGALNDVTVTQASVVETLHEEDPRRNVRELYTRAMRVGFDHMGSMVNVLVLAYAAGTIPSLLLFYRDPNPVWQKVNGEGFAAEITNVLVGASCLLLAVPLTTYLAALLIKRGRRPSGEAVAAD